MKRHSDHQERNCLDHQEEDLLFLFHKLVLQVLEDQVPRGLELDDMLFDQARRGSRYATEYLRSVQTNLIKLG